MWKVPSLSSSDRIDGLYVFRSADVHKAGIDGVAVPSCDDNAAHSVQFAERYCDILADAFFASAKLEWDGLAAAHGVAGVDHQEWND